MRPRRRWMRRETLIAFSRLCPPSDASIRDRTRFPIVAGASSCCSSDRARRPEICLLPARLGGGPINPFHQTEVSKPCSLSTLADRPASEMNRHSDCASRREHRNS